NFNNYTGGTGDVLSKNRLLGLWRYAMVVLLLLITGLNANSQDNNYPAANTKCVSNDMQVIDATLGQNCISCEAGDDITGTLILSVKNTTNSTRRSFAYWARVEITNPDGTVQPLQVITGCEPGPW